MNAKLNPNWMSLGMIAALTTVACTPTAPKKSTNYIDYIGTGLAKLNIDDDASDAGGTNVKTLSDVMGDGVDKIAEVRAAGQTAEQQQAQVSSDTGQVGATTLEANANTDLAAGIDAGSTTAVKEPPADQQQS